MRHFMSNNVKRKTPFMSPDSLRATLNMLKSFYSTHTDKNKNREDIDGLQYSGIVENYGSELLLESRKLLMNRPPLKDIRISNELDFYFDIGYSKIISNYDQQNILVATLKDNVLLSNKQYQLKYQMCVEESTLRAESSSDPNVKVDKYVITTFDPILIITDSETGEVEEITLALRDNTEASTDYMFFINPSTEDLIESFDGVTLITKPITNKMNGLPFIWMCVKAFRLTPDIGFTNNVDHMSNDLLTVGTDGHGDSWLYPLIYGADNLPAPDEYDGEWFIKIYSTQNTPFNQNGNNSSVKIDRISYVLINDNDLIFENTITYDQTYIDIFVNNGLKWIFKRAVSGDYDYDGMTYNNPIYGIIPISAFIGNIPDSTDGSYTPAFSIKFNSNYLHEYEDECENAISGIHIDSSSEFTDNSIMKKNGVMHNLGDFDGLPNHFKYLMDKTIHRAHVELYSIRDGLNDSNQKAMDKQTSAIILDTSIPPTEVENIELNIVIKYDDLIDGYVTDGVSLSPDNFLSELTYIDNNNIGNINISGQEDLPKFIYNGNRTFSLYQRHDINGPERARAYYVNNDSIPYENNDRSTTPKPLRTIARICDIPTSYSQLIKVEHISPYVIIDEKYNRTENNLSDDDLNDIWNDTSSGMVVLNTTNGVKSLFSTDDNLDELLNVDYLKEHYSTMENLNYSINLLDYEYGPDWLIEIVDGGSGYALGDTFMTVIGYDKISIELINVGEDGVAIGHKTNFKGPCLINVNNLDGLRTNLVLIPTKTNGKGFAMELVLSEEVWKDAQRYKGEIKDNLYAYKLDENGDVWIWEYDIYKSKWFKTTRVTGEEITPNPYNTSSDELRDVMMYNMFNVSPICDSIKSVNTYRVENDLINRQDALYVFNNPDKKNPVVYTRNETGNRFLLPKNHGVSLESYENKTNRLSFIDNGVQPNVFVYNPYENMCVVSTKITNDLMKLTESYPMTFVDIFKGIDNTPLNIDTGVLNNDIYQYNEYVIPDDFEYKYPGQNDVVSFRHMNEQVVNVIGNNTYEPIGEQPVGVFKCISDTTHNSNVYVGSSKYDSNPLLIFKVPNDIESLDKYRITDDTGCDISEYSLIIKGTDMFVFNDGKWIKTK